MSKAYSTNGEDFIYSDAQDALGALGEEGLLCEGQVYYEADTAPVDLAEFLRADEILERAEELLSDEVDDAAEGAYSATDEAIAELDSALKAWVVKHLSDVRVWRVVGPTRELTVTAADMAEYDDGGNHAS